MAKDYFTDPNPQGGNRSIRNIPISVGRPQPTQRMNPVQQQPVRRPAQDDAPRVRHGGASRALWLFAILALIALAGFLGVALLRKTTVTITPKSHTVVFDENARYRAFAENDATAPEGSLRYRTSTFTLDESATVPASGSEQVQDFASGTITIYNAHDANPVRLIKNTRFEAPDGKVFRIRNSVIVPGKTAAGPGTLTATVYADQPGEQYNIPAVDRFSLPGLKTSSPDMFANVYAKSNAPMTGGLVGERPIVAEADLSKARTALRESLSAKAQQQAAGELTSDNFSFPQLMKIEFTSDAAKKEGDGSVSITEHAQVSIPVFAHTDFSRTIALATSASGGEGIVRIPDTKSFTLTLHQDEVPADSSAIVFSLAGSATLVWDVDTAALAKDLSGSSKQQTSFENITSAYPGIGEADALVRPLWRSTFPENPEEIRIIIQEPVQK